MDNSAEFVIHALCDDVIKALMAKLGLEIPIFKLKRRVRIAVVTEQEQKKLLIEGIDHDGTPYTLFTQVDLTLSGQSVPLKKEPFTIFLCSAKGVPWYQIAPTPAATEASVVLHFQGHYAEPTAKISFQLKDLNEKIYTLEFTPLKPEPREWDNIVLVSSH